MGISSIFSVTKLVSPALVYAFRRKIDPSFGIVEVLRDRLIPHFLTDDATVSFRELATMFSCDPRYIRDNLKGSGYRDQGDGLIYSGTQDINPDEPIQAILFSFFDESRLIDRIFAYTTFRKFRKIVIDLNRNDILKMIDFDQYTLGEKQHLKFIIAYMIKLRILDFQPAMCLKSHLTKRYSYRPSSLRFLFGW